MNYVTLELPRTDPHEDVEEIVNLSYAAREAIAPFVPQSPIVEFPSGVPGVELVVKDETRNGINGYKLRGGASALVPLAKEGVTQVVTASAGTHLMALGYMSGKLGLECTGVMSRRANPEKVNKAHRLGARVVRYGESYDEAARFAEVLAESEGLHNVHAFRNPYVRAGQGTIGHEIKEEEPDATHVVVPAGGGGLATGLGSVVRHLMPQAQLVVAQVEGCSAFVDSLQAGQAVTGPADPRFEGIAVGSPDPKNIDIAMSLANKTMIVPTASVYRTMYDWLQQTGVVLETAGALGLTASLALAQELGQRGEAARIVTVATGANPPAAMQPYLERRFGARLFLP